MKTKKAKWPNYNKFRNQRTTYAGRSFRSKGEKTLFQLLELREKAKEIRDIKQEVRVVLAAQNVNYYADFSAFDVKLGEQVWFEFKGCWIEPWPTKLNLWRAWGPGRLEVYERGKDYPRLMEVVIPDPAKRVNYDNA